MRFPVFPLNGAILFPKTNLPLNIFEQKYIEMIDYALSKNRLIGMIQTKESGELFNIGCLGKITNFTETQDGRYQINLEGLNRFKFKKIVKTNYKFITIDAEVVNYKQGLNKQNLNLREKLLSSFKKYLNAKKINFDTSEFEALEISNLAKIICVISPLDYLTKQMLLECENEYEICNNLLSALEIDMQNTGANLQIN